MIKKIDIQKFGLFSDYNWNSEVGSDPEKDVFKKVNIIYGRNYSGKTTLSRIFRCVETGEPHEDYEEAEFTIYTDNGIINQSNLSYSNQIRVYNTDFVKKNLSWLHDNKGEILPFTLLGEGNQDIVEKIADLEKNIKDIDLKLGAINQETGLFEEGTLYFNQSKKKLEFDNAIIYLRNLEADLTRKISNKANQDIKKNPNFINQKNSSSYNVNSLKDVDIAYIRNNNLDCLLSDDEQIQLKVIIKEEDKESISNLPNTNFSFNDYINNTKTLLAKEIGLSLKLKELIENDLLQDWVKTGRNLHKQSDICAFCKNPISETRRKELDGHFSKESEELEQKIQTLLNQLESLQATIESYLSKHNITKDRFYIVLHPKYEELYLKWNEAIDRQKGQIEFLKEKLSGRLKNLFSPITNIDFSKLETNTIDFEPIINDFNSLIIENNNKTISIEDDKNNARKTLRYHAIKNFLSDIDYDGLLNAIEKAKQEKDKVEDEFKQFDPIISKKTEDKTKLQSQIEELKTKLDDQELAAEKINEHLRNFFGHDSIQLKPSEQQIDDDVITRFVVKRGEEEAKNLSEGECSLVAFCYFMARIEDEIQAPDAKEKLIIYIDDPISSLDNNHIFFIFGLIESVITKSKKFNQLFISTHNLEFLRYLKRLTVPNDEIIDEEGKKKSQKSWTHYLVYKNKNYNQSQSHIRNMPIYLSSYTTEYNFLFSQIYKMATPDSNKITLYENEFSLLYNLPNNMRKFLECFLFYKYPDTHNPLNSYLSKLFNGAVHPKVNRIINEYSHLTWGERGTIPTDVAEAEETAQLILKAIKDKDIEHYEALCKSIKVDPNIVLP